MDVRIAAPRELWPPDSLVEDAEREALVSGARVMVTDDTGAALERCSVRLHRRVGQHGRGRRRVGAPRAAAHAVPRHGAGDGRDRPARHPIPALPPGRSRHHHRARPPDPRALRARRGRGHRRACSAPPPQWSSNRPRTGSTRSRPCSSRRWGDDMLLVVALGGNALLERGERPDAEVQQRHVRIRRPRAGPTGFPSTRWCCATATGRRSGCSPSRARTTRSSTHPFPLDTLGAQTQGMIGYWLAQELGNAGMAAPAVAIVTQTVVDRDGSGVRCADEVRAGRVPGAGGPTASPPSTDGRSPGTPPGGAGSSRLLNLFGLSSCPRSGGWWRAERR